MVSSLVINPLWLVYLFSPSLAPYCWSIVRHSSLIPNLIFSSPEPGTRHNPKLKYSFQSFSGSGLVLVLHWVAGEQGHQVNIVIIINIIIMITIIITFIPTTTFIIITTLPPGSPGRAERVLEHPHGLLLWLHKGAGEGESWSPCLSTFQNVKATYLRGIFTKLTIGMLGKISNFETPSVTSPRSKGGWV